MADGRSAASTWIAPALALAAMPLAWGLRFVQDDAFISYTYARALVSGEGLTWFGTRVEGYTNFLWVLWIALGMKLGLDPVDWSYAGGLAAFAAVLWATLRCCRSLSGDELRSTVAIAVLATNYSVLSYATGGLETMAQTAVIAASAAVVVRERAPKATGFVALALLAIAGMMIRMDTVVALAPILGFWAWRTRVRGFRYVAGMTALVAAVLGPWLAWKWSYYGSILPNSFHAKIGLSAATLGNGALYVGRFVHWYLLWVPLALGLCVLVARRRLASLRSTLLVIPILLWLAYVVAVGGDFMEFRFLVPVAPLLAIFLADVVCVAFEDRRPLQWVSAALTVVLLAGASTRHSVTFTGRTPDITLDSIHLLATFYGRYPDRDWARVGTALGRRFSGHSVRIAADAVGAIPYYSRIDTVDTLGLNDVAIARGGTVAPPTWRRPGHRRRASIDQLRERRVNFVLGHPTLFAQDYFHDPEGVSTVSNWVADLRGFGEPLPRSVTITLIPVEDRMGIIAWYLHRTPELDALVSSWPTLELQR